MTVADLMAELQKMPQDAEVMRSEDGGHGSMVVDRARFEPSVGLPGHVYIE
jgi:hypothetical protein